MTLRQAPLRKSMFRNATVMGAERTPILVLLTISAILIFSGMTLLTTVLGITILIGGVAGLRAAAKAHPQMTQVYMKFIKYRKYYPATLVHPAPMPHKAIIRNSKKDL